MNTITKIIEHLEQSNIQVYEYKEQGKLCGYELNTYTDKGVNMLIFLDFRDTKKDVNSASDFIEMFNDRVNDVIIDEEIEIHRQNKMYVSTFTIDESLKDFKEWKDSLLLMFKGDDAVNIQIQDFKQEVEKLESELKKKIYSICKKLDYKNSSRFGRTINRLEQFTKDVKEFSNNE